MCFNIHIVLTTDTPLHWFYFSFYFYFFTNVFKSSTVTFISVAHLCMCVCLGLFVGTLSPSLHLMKGVLSEIRKKMQTCKSAQVHGLKIFGKLFRPEVWGNLNSCSTFN